MSPTISDEAPGHEELTALTTLIEHEDGAPPLSDQTWAQLDSAQVRHLTARDGGALLGYAQREHNAVEIAAQAAVVPALLAAAGPGSLLVWSHGRRSRVAPVLADAGFTRTRELHQLRRPLDGDHPLPDDPALADGIIVRAFDPATDGAAWLRVNAAAFARHPEQGEWTEHDLQARLAEPWFEPAGFLLAERDGTLLGFHWTKIHPDGLGEVYVLGVSPEAQGLGLGRALLVRGLRHLAGRDCSAVLLYVDGDNDAALHLYAKDGFGNHDLDVQWSGIPTT